MAAGPVGLSLRLERVLTPLAQLVIRDKPSNIEAYCYEYFARRVENTSGNGECQGKSMNDVSAQDVQGEILVRELSLRKEKGLPLFEYDEDDSESDEDGENNEKKDSGYSSDQQNSRWHDRKVRADGGEFDVYGPNSFDLPKSEAEGFNEEVKAARTDKRTKELFALWDRDGSGAIDISELAMELHKFEKIAKEGSDLRLASDAIIQFDDSNDRELQFDEFVQVIVRFCNEILKSSYSDTVDYLVIVAKHTSEKAAKYAAEGRDVSKIKEEDEEDELFLKQAITGMKDEIHRNILRIREEIRSPKGI